jgi:hypothetical protein
LQGAAFLELNVMDTLEEELQRIHDAGIGVSITWLSDGRVDLRLVHKSGAVAAEGNVKEVAEVLPWLETAIKCHFPKAMYTPPSPLAGSSRKPVVRAGIGKQVAPAVRLLPMESRSRMAARNEP